MIINCSGLLILCFLTLSVNLVLSWNQWDYGVQWSETPAKISALSNQWHGYWDPNYRGNLDPPRPRRGHSLHLVKTDPRSAYGDNTYIVMFGGRDNDQKAQHIPKTYEVKSVCMILFCISLKNASLIFICYIA